VVTANGTPPMVIQRKVITLAAVSDERNNYQNNCNQKAIKNANKGAYFDFPIYNFYAVSPGSTEGWLLSNVSNPDETGVNRCIIWVGIGITSKRCHANDQLQIPTTTALVNLRTVP
jgi:hypothetical protein